MKNPWVRAFAPATVSNVGPGFDIFGFAIEGMGDVVEARLSPRPGVQLLEITGDDGSLPRSAHSNTAGIAALQVLQHLGRGGGVELRLRKGMPLASGLGSSAASAVAAAVAVNAAFEADLPREKLLRCAIEGERVACGAAHGDNAAPSLYGGFVLVRGGEAPRVDPLPVPRGLCCALLRPPVAVQTGTARALLGDRVALEQAVIQWGNAAALVAGLFREDWELLASAIQDVVAEPLRGHLVPGFDAVKKAALEAGALGCGLSGSGPSIFALCRQEEECRTVLEAMKEALRATADLSADSLMSPVGAAGARVLKNGEMPCAM